MKTKHGSWGLVWYIIHVYNHICNYLYRNKYITLFYCRYIYGICISWDSGALGVPGMNILRKRFHNGRSLMCLCWHIMIFAYYTWCHTCKTTHWTQVGFNWDQVYEIHVHQCSTVYYLYFGACQNPEIGQKDITISLRALYQPSWSTVKQCFGRTPSYVMASPVGGIRVNYHIPRGFICARPRGHCDQRVTLIWLIGCKPKHGKNMVGI